MYLAINSLRPVTKTKKAEHGHKHKQGCRNSWRKKINLCASLTLNWTQGGTVVMPWMYVKGTTAWPFPELLRPRANTRLSQVTGHNNTSVSYWRPYFNISSLIHDKSETKRLIFLFHPPSLFYCSLHFTPRYCLLMWPCSLITDCLEKQNRVFHDITSTLDILHKLVVWRTGLYSESCLPACSPPRNQCRFLASAAFSAARSWDQAEKSSSECEECKQKEASLCCLGGKSIHQSLSLHSNPAKSR